MLINVRLGRLLRERNCLIGFESVHKRKSNKIGGEPVTVLSDPLQVGVS